MESVMISEKSLYERALKVMPGGVCSSTRLNKAIERPFFISSGRGSKVYDLTGKEYVDMNCSHGATLLGHKHPAIIKAIEKATELGYICSAETEYQVELAEKLCSIIPCFERVRFCTSGSEATLHLLRACRAYTGKDKIIRMVGHFHGYHEFVYIGGHPPMDKLGSNLKTPYIESSGIPEIMRDLIIPVPFNDIEAFKKAVEVHGHEVCAVIMEPVNYNSACIKPCSDYLKEVREITKDTGILLFFDEIQSSFKKSAGGAQQDFGITPDVCTIGKSFGGGIPISAFGGKAEIMDLFKPKGNVQHSGTFNAHLIQILPALAFVDEITKPYFYPYLQKLEKKLHDGLERIVEDFDIPVLFPHHGARFDIIIGLHEIPKHYSELKDHDHARMLMFIRESIARGVYYHDYSAGSACHHGYSIQHTEDDIDKVLDVTKEVLGKLF